MRKRLAVVSLALVTACDASKLDDHPLDSVFRIAAESTLVVNGTPTASAHWVEGTANVTVSDGRLTLTSAAGAANNKICFVEITQL